MVFYWLQVIRKKFLTYNRSDCAIKTETFQVLAQRPALLSVKRWPWGAVSRDFLGALTFQSSEVTSLLLGTSCPPSRMQCRSTSCVEPLVLFSLRFQIRAVESPDLHSTRGDRDPAAHTRAVPSIPWAWSHVSPLWQAVMLYNVQYTIPQ